MTKFVLGFPKLLFSLFSSISVNYKLMCIISYGGFLLSLVGAYANVKHLAISNLFLTVGLVLFVSGWIIILSDIVKKPIYNRTFWLQSMFILAPVAPLVYLTQRSKLVKSIPN